MKPFTWQTTEYVHQEKSPDWYWTVGIIATALVVISVIFGNTLFGLVLAIGAFALAMFASRRPNVILVNVHDKGITIDKTLYPFVSLQSFYIDESHRYGPQLIFKSKKMIMPLIVIPLETEKTDDLRTFLETRLKEEKVNPGLLHTLLESLGF